MESLEPETLVRMFFIGLGIATAYGSWRGLVSLWNQKKKGDLYDKEIQEQALHESLEHLSDADLADHANETLGNGPPAGTKASDVLKPRGKGSV